MLRFNTPKAFPNPESNPPHALSFCDNILAESLFGPLVPIVHPVILYPLPDSNPPFTI